MVRSCITFAGTRVDQLVAIEVLEALRPLGVQAALDALDHSQNQTDEKRELRTGGLPQGFWAISA